MVKKALILAGGLGTRFLPLSKIVPKQFLPLADKPAFQYVVEEIKDAGIEEIIFVTEPKYKKILDFFKPNSKINKSLKAQGKKPLLEELRGLESLSEEISFSSVSQKKPLGNGDAVLKAKSKLKTPFAVSYVDDVIDSKVPALSQLGQVFKTSQKPVLALKRVPKEEFSDYGLVEAEKIASSLYKIKSIVEKPSPEEAPSDLTVVGRFILTPQVVDYLKNVSVGKNEEKTIYHGLEGMINDGKVIYGFEIKGKWLSLGDKLRYLKSNLYFALKSQYGEELKKYLKQQGY